jgi:hypothetical protein
MRKLTIWKYAWFGLILLLIGLFPIPTMGAEGKEYTVAIEIQCDDPTLEMEILRYTQQGLRSLGDIKLVSEEPQFTLSFACCEWGKLLGISRMYTAHYWTARHTHMIFSAIHDVGLIPRESLEGFCLGTVTLLNKTYIDLYRITGNPIVE